MFRIVQKCNIVSHDRSSHRFWNEYLYPDKEIARFDKKWKARWYRWKEQFFWDEIIHSEIRWEIEEIKEFK